MLKSSQIKKCTSNNPAKPTFKMNGKLKPETKQKKLKSERSKRLTVVKEQGVAKLGGDLSLPASVTISKTNSTKDLGAAYLGGLLQQRKQMNINWSGQKPQADSNLGSKS